MLLLKAFVLPLYDLELKLQPAVAGRIVACILLAMAPGRQ